MTENRNPLFGFLKNKEEKPPIQKQEERRGPEEKHYQVNPAWEPDPEPVPEQRQAPPHTPPGTKWQGRDVYGREQFEAGPAVQKEMGIEYDGPPNEPKPEPVRAPTRIDYPTPARQETAPVEPQKEETRNEDGLNEREQKIYYLGRVDGAKEMGKALNNYILELMGGLR